MSVLENIRKRSGLLLAVILIAISLFVVQQWLDDPSRGVSSGANVVAEIEGESVDRRIFDWHVNLYETEHNMQGQQPANEYIRKQWKSRAWEQIIYQFAYQGQYDKLGLVITEDGVESEAVDMVQGLTPTDEFRRFGSDEFGNYDPQKVRTFLNNVYQGVDAQNEEAIRASNSLEIAKIRSKVDRLSKKYADLLSKSVFVTTAEAKKSHEELNATATFNYLYVPYYGIEDSLFSADVTDEKLQAYLDENKAKYLPKEAIRAFEYVTFEIAPTKGDSLDALARATEHKDAFLDSSVNSNEYIQFSSAPVSDSSIVKYASLPQLIKADSLNLAKGNVYGPELAGDQYQTYKILNVIDSDTLLKATASHILITADTANMSDSLIFAKLTLANDVLQKAMSGDDFAILAKTFSEDPGSKDNGGTYEDIENNGQMVPEFENAIFEAKKEGVISRLIQTQFGFHIIKVDEAPTKADPKFVYGFIQETLEASTNTIDSIGEVADDFLTSVDDIESFREAVEGNEDLLIFEANSVPAYADRIGKLDNITSAIYWAFTDAEEGQVYSELINGEGQYGILAFKGAADLEEVSLAAVKADVERDYIQELKKEYILKKIAETSGTLVEREGKLKELLKDAIIRYDQAKDHALASNNVGAGTPDPMLVGTAFGLSEGENSVPLASDNGVFIVETLKKTAAEEKDNYDVEIEALLQKSTRSNFGILVNQAIKSNIEINDYRFKL